MRRSDTPEIAGAVPASPTIFNERKIMWTHESIEAYFKDCMERWSKDTLDGARVVGVTIEDYGNVIYPPTDEELDVLLAAVKSDKKVAAYWEI
jgi:hypothetical protein